MLQGNNVLEQVYRYLYSEYKNHFGVSSLMGLMYTRSGIDPISVDASLKRKLKNAGSSYCTDKSYTEAVDNGFITKAEFVHPMNKYRLGYGLMQWSAEPEKSGIYDIAKSKKKSIGDLEIQLSLLVQEISKNYSQLEASLKKTRSFRTAIAMILKYYDANTLHTDKSKAAIVDASKNYYTMFSNIVTSDVEQDNDEVKASTKIKAKNDTSGFSLNDRVIVNGTIYGNGHGTGIAIEKNNAVMYVVGFARADRYPYNIGLALVKGGPRQGWASSDSLSKVSTVPGPTPTKVLVAKQSPKSGLSSFIGDYAATLRIYIRNDAGTHSFPLVAIPEGHVVSCVEGKYTSFQGTKWLYVETIYQSVKYTGFCSSEYLIRL